MIVIQITHFVKAKVNSAIAPMERPKYVAKQRAANSVAKIDHRNNTLCGGV
jgi:hypothetical protein